MESNNLKTSNNQVIFQILLRANFYNSGKYDYYGKCFHFFFGESNKSLHNYIINNKKEFINFIKQKRERNGKLTIRKKDDYDFIENLEITDISLTVFSNSTLSLIIKKDEIYFTDLGLITAEEWCKHKSEFLI
jgi:hypothetical protein